MALLICAIMAADPAKALDGDGDAEPTGRWQGTSWGFELRTGLGFRTYDDAITPAPIIGAGVRLCTLLTLIDMELYATTEGFSRTTNGGQYELRRTSIGMDFRLHPMFMRHLQGGFADRVMAGIHLVFGLGADVLSIDGGGDSERRDRTDLALALGIGLGVDIPLTEPNSNPWSVWLGVGWRMRFAGFPDSAPGLRDMDEHVALINIGIRFHDLTGFRAPVPPELDDADR